MEDNSSPATAGDFFIVTANKVKQSLGIASSVLPPRKDKNFKTRSFHKINKYDSLSSGGVMLNTALYEGTLTLEEVRTAKQRKVLLMDLDEFLAYSKGDTHYSALTNAQKVRAINPDMGIEKVWQFLVVHKRRLVERNKKMGPTTWAEICRLVDLWPNERPNDVSFTKWKSAKRLAANNRTPLIQYIDNESHRGRIRNKIFQETKNQLVFTGELQTRLSIDVDAFVKDWI